MTSRCSRYEVHIINITRIRIRIIINTLSNNKYMMMDYTIKQGDCLELMKEIPDKSIDMTLCDLPYGTTACKWDAVIPFDPLWEQYNRVMKEDGAIVLFGSEPFSTLLRMSNMDWYKYDWVWDKVRGVGHLLSKKRPMICTENIMVFYKKQPVYNPQMRWREHPRQSMNNGTDEVWNGDGKRFVGEVLDKKYPINLLTFSKSNMEENAEHPTQKPVELLEYLIRTYTNIGDTVLDNCMGSGSTGIACIKTGRRFIGYELEEKYFKIAEKRLEEEKAQMRWLLLP